MKNILPVQNSLKNVTENNNFDENNYLLLHNLSFSIPIHLRYHIPYDNSFPLKNTDFSPNPDFKTVKLQKPNVYFGNSKCVKKFQILQKYPVLKRIYDISFLGQEGNAISFSQKEEKKNYKKLHHKMQSKNISQNDKIKIENVNFNDDYNFEDDFYSAFYNVIFYNSFFLLFVRSLSRYLLVLKMKYRKFSLKQDIFAVFEIY